MVLDKINLYFDHSKLRDVEKKRGFSPSKHNTIFCVHKLRDHQEGVAQSTHIKKPTTTKLENALKPFGRLKNEK